MLSAKRCGSTAIFKSFQKHPNVKICNENQKIENYEIQFWTNAIEAINGNYLPLKNVLKNSFPTLDVSKFEDNKLSKKKIFDLWNYILEKRGPILFDKSPQYLGSKAAINLILEYKLAGNDVRLFSLIRNPRDAISSQHELWKEYTNEQNLLKREIDWLNNYKNLEEINKIINIPLFYYEKIANNPEYYFSEIYKFCEIDFEKTSFSHFKKVSINRFNLTFDKTVKNWKWSKDFEFHIKKYDYSLTKNQNFLIKLFFNLVNYKKFIPLKFKNFLRKFINF
jgi:hypothetical protein